MEAICSEEVVKFTNDLRKELGDISEELKSQNPLLAIEKLKDEIKTLKQELKNASKTKALEISKVGDVAVVVSEFDGDIKTKIDEVKNSYEKAVILLASSKDGRVSIAAGVKNTQLKAGELVKQVATIVGGNGGGRDDFATAGGKDASKLKDALEFATNYIKEKLSWVMK